MHRVVAHCLWSGEDSSKSAAVHATLRVLLQFKPFIRYFCSISSCLESVVAAVDTKRFLNAHSYLRHLDEGDHSKIKPPSLPGNDNALVLQVQNCILNPCLQFSIHSVACLRRICRRLHHFTVPASSKHHFAESETVTVQRLARLRIASMPFGAHVARALSSDLQVFRCITRRICSRLSFVAAKAQSTMAEFSKITLRDMRKTTAWHTN